MTQRGRARLHSISPWDKRDASRAVLLLLSVMSVLNLVNVLAFDTPSRTARIISFAQPALWAVLLPQFLKHGHRRPAPLYSVFGVLSGVLITVISMLDRDASAATQLFYVLPLLFAGSALRPVGAGIVTAVLIAEDGVLVFSQLPFQTGLRDWLYAVAIMPTVAFLLVRGAAAQQRLTAVLREQATVDSLTGLVNRRVLDEAASSAIASTQGAEGTALILIDVDNFKTINDTYGHPGGDQVLAHIADVIGRNSRQDSVISRIGGDEMAVLLPRCTSEVAIRRAAQIVAAISGTPVFLDGGEQVRISVSAGVAHAPTDGADLSPTVYAAADAGLYKAKRQGRNQVGTPS